MTRNRRKRARARRSFRRQKKIARVKIFKDPARFKYFPVTAEALITRTKWLNYPSAPCLPRLTPTPLSSLSFRRALSTRRKRRGKKRHLQNADDILIAGASGARAPSRCSKKNMATVFSKGGKSGREEGQTTRGERRGGRGGARGNNRPRRFEFRRLHGHGRQSSLAVCGVDRNGRKPRVFVSFG